MCASSSSSLISYTLAYSSSSSSQLSLLYMYIRNLSFIYTIKCFELLYVTTLLKITFNNITYMYDGYDIITQHVTGSKPGIHTNYITLNYTTSCPGTHITYYTIHEIICCIHPFLSLDNLPRGAVQY